MSLFGKLFGETKSYQPTKQEKHLGGPDASSSRWDGTSYARQLRSKGFELCYAAPHEVEQEHRNDLTGNIKNVIRGWCNGDVSNVEQELYGLEKKYQSYHVANAKLPTMKMLSVKRGDNDIAVEAVKYIYSQNKTVFDIPIRLTFDGNCWRETTLHTTFPDTFPDEE